MLQNSFKFYCVYGDEEFTITRASTSYTPVTKDVYIKFRELDILFSKSKFMDFLGKTLFLANLNVYVKQYSSNIITNEDKYNYFKIGINKLFYNVHTKYDIDNLLYIVNAGICTRDYYLINSGFKILKPFVYSNTVRGSQILRYYILNKKLWEDFYGQSS